MVFNGIWGAALLALAIILWKKQPIAYRVSMITAPVYAVTTITWSYVFTRGEFERSQLPFQAGITLAATGIVFFILTRRSTRAALGQIKNPDKETDIV